MDPKVSRGTVWTQPCRAAPDGLHSYRRPVVPAGALNDLRLLAAKVIRAFDEGEDPSPALEKLRAAVYDD